MKKLLALCLGVTLALSLALPAVAAPLPVISYYAFQPDGTPFHYYSFGDELFYDVRYDGVAVCEGFDLAGQPRGSSADGWTRCTTAINGQYQLINARYKQDTPDLSRYPTENQDMLLLVTLEGQNGPAQIDEQNKVITLYLKPDASLKAPDMEVAVSSLGYRNLQGPVWWSLTNDSKEKEELQRLFDAGLAGDSFLDRSSWEEFGLLFNASMENKVDLSQKTWLTIGGSAIGGYFLPTFAQYEIVCKAEKSPLAETPLTLPRTAEFDKRPLYQANVIFNFTDYTKTPVFCLLDGERPPENAVTFSDFLCVLNHEYLATKQVGDSVELTVVFHDDTEDTVSVTIQDTSAEGYVQVFRDVGSDQGAWEFIHPLVEAGVIEKTGDLFGSDEIITRDAFYGMLTNAGFPVGEASEPEKQMTALEAENLLFSVLTSPQYAAEYQALNKQHLWLPNVYGDLEAERFAFFDMVLPSPERRIWGEQVDEAASFTRAEAAEALYRFQRLIAYAGELHAVQNPLVSPTRSEIRIDGKAVAFDAYNIDGYHYFKLRDLAFALNGTEKQFAVDYDAETGYIKLVPQEAYMPVGGEMTLYDGGLRQAGLSQVYISVNRAGYRLTAYEMDGHNYVKLRDVARMIPFAVGYDAETGVVSVDTQGDW